MFWGTPEGDIFHPVECMHQLLDTVRRHKVNIDGNICTVMVTILVLEVNLYIVMFEIYKIFTIRHLLDYISLQKDAQIN